MTHKLHTLKHVDEVIYMAEGKIEEQGSFEELLLNNGAFANYMAEYLLEQETQLVADEEDRDFLLRVKGQVEPKMKEISQSLSLSTSLFSRGAGNSRKFSKSKPETEFKGQLIQTEEMAVGSVKFQHHRKYYEIIGYWYCGAILLALFLSNLFQVLDSIWLSDWSNDSFDRQLALDVSNRNFRITVYAILGCFEVLFSFLGTLGITYGSVIAAKQFHNQMLTRIIRAPMAFFGKILWIVFNFSNENEISRYNTDWSNFESFLT